jgi:hydroxymethylpyrimidine pyrophosphatase-like HAD family hydrolase
MMAEMPPDQRPAKTRALATDYDGTLAQKGRVDDRTLAALERLRADGWTLLLVTGRNLDDVARVFPDLPVFDRVVAENGALVAGADGHIRKLGPAPDPILLSALELRAVPYSTGRVAVHTLTAYEAPVLQAIRDSGAEVAISRNKGALMLLPRGVDKAAGLRAALDELGVDPAAVVGVGDAENDLPFLQICGRAYACADALPAVRAAAGRYTRSVRELVEELLGD